MSTFGQVEGGVGGVGGVDSGRCEFVDYVVVKYVQLRETHILQPRKTEHIFTAAEIDPTHPTHPTTTGTVAGVSPAAFHHPATVSAVSVSSG